HETERLPGTSSLSGLKSYHHRLESLYDLANLRLGDVEFCLSLFARSRDQLLAADFGHVLEHLVVAHGERDTLRATVTALENFLDECWLFFEMVGENGKCQIGRAGPGVTAGHARGRVVDDLFQFVAAPSVGDFHLDRVRFVLTIDPALHFKVDVDAVVFVPLHGYWPSCACRSAMRFFASAICCSHSESLFSMPCFVLNSAS